MGLIKQAGVRGLIRNLPHSADGEDWASRRVEKSGLHLREYCRSGLLRSDLHMSPLAAAIGFDPALM